MMFFYIDNVDLADREINLEDFVALDLTTVKEIVSNQCKN